MALAYGESRCLGQCEEFVGQITGPTKVLVEKVFRVYAIDCVKRDIGFYISEGAISGKGANNLLIAQMCSTCFKHHVVLEPLHFL